MEKLTGSSLEQTVSGILRSSSHRKASGVKILGAHLPLQECSGSRSRPAGQRVSLVVKHAASLYQRVSLSVSWSLFWEAQWPFLKIK